jgi:hypothetical protein
VWAIASAITLVGWSLRPSGPGAAGDPSTAITIAVLGMAFIKARLITQYFMEVRTSPRWLHICTDSWLIVLWAAILATYLV